MRIHTRLKALLLCFCLTSAGVVAQPPQGPAQEPAWAARSGDAWIDRQLADINAYAARHPEPFADELVRYFDAPRELVTERIARRRAMPGDVYYACAIARVTGRPCRSVLDEWDRSQAAGWGAVAERMGVAAGSPAAARLQQAFGDSYARWARPPPAAPAADPARRRGASPPN